MAVSLAVSLCHGRSNAAETLTATTLATGTYQSRAYQLLRLSKNPSAPSYALWFPPAPGTGKQPAVLLTQPYTGIDWTGDPKDLYFAGLPNSGLETLQEDVFGPDFSPGESGPINYHFKTVETVSSEGYPYLVNGLGVLFIFERFYTGGGFNNDVDDTVMGFDFLATQTTVDPGRIGVGGGSLGGALAIHAAARAPAGGTPCWGVAWAPPVDMPSFYDYADRQINNLVPNSAKLNAWKRTFDPYLRRLRASGLDNGSGSPDLSVYSYPLLKTHLTTRFLLLHDTWDTIVPFSQSRGLYQNRPQTTETLFVPRPTPIDYSTFDLGHSPRPSSWDAWYWFTLANVYLLKNLLPAGSFTGLYHAVEFSSFVGYLRDQQSLGKDISSLAPRLLDMCDARLFLLDFNNLAAPPRPGREVVAEIINRAWGTRVAADQVAFYLAHSGLPDAVQFPDTPDPGPKAFPNPFRLEDNGSGLRLVQLTPGLARLYGVSGRWVRDIVVDDYGTALWDGRDNDGTPVAPGVYILRSTTGRERLKIAVLR